jgi:hypothetical protein
MKEDGVMGQSVSGKEREPRESIVEEFQALQQLVGDWFVDESVFLTPDAEPILSNGRVTCRSATEALSIVVITEIATTGERAITLVTFNPRNDRYELSLVNTLSDVGLIVMTGRSLMTRSSEEVRAQFGKAAMAVREWNLEQNFSGGPALAVPERIVENKINNDLWVLQFFARDEHGEFRVFRQQVLTRANVGCQPQVGCELGCPGLVGCQEGCEGLQGPPGRAQLGCGCQPQLMGQQVIAQPQVVVQPPLMTPMQIIALAPSVCVTQPACGRQPLRSERPERPTHPKHRP